MSKQEFSEFDYHPERDEIPSKVRWIIVLISLGMALYLATILV